MANTASVITKPIAETVAEDAYLLGIQEDANEEQAVYRMKLADVCADKAASESAIYKANLLLDFAAKLPTRANGFNVTSGTTEEIIFNTANRAAIKKYAVRIATDTNVGFTKIEFRNTSNSVVATIYPGTIKVGNPYVTVINPTGTAKINRIKVFAPTATATLMIYLYDYDRIVSAGLNANQALDFISDLSVNKTATVEWLSGYIVSAINLNYPVASSGWSITSFDCRKGDYVKITYPSGHSPDAGKCVLSEKIIYGSGELQYGFSAIFKGGSPDVYEYICGKDMTLTVCANNSYKPEILCYSLPAYGQSAEFAEDRYNQFAYNETQRKLVIAKAARNNYDATLYPKPLTLLHFSDIHNAFYNAKNISVFMKKYGDVFDDVILSGDMSGTFANYRPIYALEDYKKFLLCIGNHDVYDADGTHSGSDNEEYWATATQKYNQYFAPTIANWSVSQPADAATNGLCYYYKDYSSNGYGYRLIVLDAMAFDDDQYNWFVSVLADAKTNELTVVIAEHFPPITGLSDIAAFETPFMSLRTGMEFNYAVSRLKASAGSAIDAVDTFITGGGEFACWLCGHMHYDRIGTLVSHPNQIFIAVASACRSAVWLDSPRVYNTPSEDCFNVISIDPYLKVIKIERIGAVTDDWGRKHDHVSINYSTRTLIATS